MAYYQFTFLKRYWKGCCGKNFITPKSEGKMLMVSAYQSREFGLGMGEKITPAVLTAVNLLKSGQDYLSVSDAMLLNNSNSKKDLTDDPSRLFFETGANRQGYWSNSRTKLQLEDVFDCLSVLYPEFDFIVLFDQSSGHCKLRDDGLNAHKMNVSYGGRVPKMHSTIVKEIGNYTSLLTIGDTQAMVFQENDDGPFWMNVNE